MQTLRMNQIEFKIFRFVTSQEIQTCTLLNIADAFLWFANWHQKPTSGFGHSFCLPAFFSTSSQIRILLCKAGPLFWPRPPFLVRNFMTLLRDLNAANILRYYVWNICPSLPSILFTWKLSVKLIPLYPKEMF